MVGTPKSSRLQKNTPFSRSVPSRAPRLMHGIIIQFKFVFCPENVPTCSSTTLFSKYAETKKTRHDYIVAIDLLSSCPKAFICDTQDKNFAKKILIVLHKFRQSVVSWHRRWPTHYRCDENRRCCSAQYWS